MPWLAQLFSRRRRYDDIDVSIREHLEEKTEELMEQGLSRPEAERAARRSFGNVLQIQEASREMWPWAVFESLTADVKFALRQLRKFPGFTIMAVATLALGIAVNTTMFSMVSAFLMPHLPGHNAQKLVVLTSIDPHGVFLPDATPVSPPNYLEWRAQRQTFAQMAASRDGLRGSLAGGDRPQSVRFSAVSPNFFPLFQAAPLLGRTFAPGDAAAGHNHVLILSYGLWQSRYASNPGIVGKTVLLNRENYTVIGVMPRSFQLLGFLPRFWTPLTLTAADQTAAARANHSLHLFARLAPGVTLQQARARLSVLAQSAQQDFPRYEKHWGATARTLPDFLVYNFGIRQAMVILLTMVAFVLLIACANVAGLLLSRGVARQNELAIRVSLGASRLRIVRQLLTEGLVLALAGGGVGLLLSVGGVRLLRAGLKFNAAVAAIHVSLDQRVLLFALAVSLLAALLSSLAPAMKASRAHPEAGLKSQGRSASAGREHARLRAFLVGGEVALALFLLLGSGLLIRGVYRIEHQRLGFQTSHLLTAGVVLDHQRYATAQQQLQFVHELTARLVELPGVESVAVTSSLPANGGGEIAVRRPGQLVTPNHPAHGAFAPVVSPGFFHTAGIPLLRGRSFTPADNASAPRVVVVNETLARQYFPAGDAVGHRLQVGTSNGAPVWSQIIGVAANVKQYAVMAQVAPAVYRPVQQQPLRSFSLMLRTRGDASSLIPGLRHAVAGIDAELPLRHISTMDQVIRSQQGGNGVFSQMLAFFAALALLLSTVGIYGLVTYSVSQRTNEIGIRLALGAKQSDISRMIVRGGLKIAGIGMLLGLLLALPLARLFDSMFAGVRFESPALYPAVTAAVLAVALTAMWIPARRARRVNPLTALREE